MKRVINTISGISLLEVMLSLAIIAVILVMAIRFWSAANTSKDRNQALGAVTAIIAAVQNYKSSNPNTTSYTQTDLFTNNFLTNDFTSSDSGKTVTAPSWQGCSGNTVTVTGTANNAAITFGSVQGTLCNAVIPNIPVGYSATCSGTGAACGTLKFTMY